MSPGVKCVVREMKWRFAREFTNWKVLYTTFMVKLLFSYSLLQGAESSQLRNIIHWEILKGFLEYKTFFGAN